jgi:hypothetical protein
MVGGCLDRRTGLHVDAEGRTPRDLRELLVRIAKVAADEDLCLTFPFVYSDVKDALAAATDGRIVWSQLAREAHFFGLSDVQWESTLKQKARNSLRHDRSMIASVPMVVKRIASDEVEPWVFELIAHQNSRKGEYELSEFVDYRYSVWQENPDIDLMVFTAELPDLRGVSTMLFSQDEIEVYEVGLTGDESNERLAVYLNLLFHLPIQYAKARGIDHIRLGSRAEYSKAARGAVFRELHGGMLSNAETKRLARRGI